MTITPKPGRGTQGLFSGVIDEHSGLVTKIVNLYFCQDLTRRSGRHHMHTYIWRNGQTWKGIKTHMGHSQQDYGAECAALAHPLESASRRNTTPERVTIFTDAQAAIRRMASEEPGAGQQYALQARKHVATLRKARQGIIIGICWCPAHKGVAGNEKADEWGKIAAEEPDTRGVEWLSDSDRADMLAMPLPRSLANLKREISEKKRVEARQ